MRTRMPWSSRTKKDLNITNIDASAVYPPDSMLRDVVVMFIMICDWSGDFINAKPAERQLREQG